MLYIYAQVRSTDLSTSIEIYSLLVGVAELVLNIYELVGGSIITIIVVVVIGCSGIVGTSNNEGRVLTKAIPCIE